MDRVSEAVEVVGRAGLVALLLPLILSCFQTTVASEQKWLSFAVRTGK